MNTIVQKAVDEINDINESNVIQEGIRLVQCIQKEEAKIAKSNEAITALQEQASKMAHEQVTPKSVFGFDLPINSNTETIAAVIVKANSERQYCVEQTTKRLADAVLSEQDAIKLVEGRIVELRKALGKLKATVVSVTQITG